MQWHAKHLDFCAQHDGSFRRGYRFVAYNLTQLALPHQNRVRCVFPVRCCFSKLLFSLPHNDSLPVVKPSDVNSMSFFNNAQAIAFQDGARFSLANCSGTSSGMSFG